MDKDTIAAVATGALSAGISIVRISGSSAISSVDSIFVAKKKGKKLCDRPSHTMTYGDIVDNGEAIDEVLVSVMKAPNTYTKEDVVEINCHGGVYITKRILETVLKTGIRLAEPGEFTKRAFLNGRIDLSQAEAVIDLINASNNEAARNSVLQLKGSLKEKIVLLRDSILHDTSFIEAALDDPEHIDLTGFSDTLRENTTENIDVISKLISGFENGMIIKNGIKTVILGKPNAGKSTLLNSLAGADRAIVTDIPGTTRDTLEETVNLDGVTLRIVDTAGIHETDDKVEKIGVEKAINEAETADLCIFVADSTKQLDEDDKRIIEMIRDRKSLFLLNKSDLNPVLSAKELSDFAGKPVITISAKNEDGLDMVSKAVKEMFSLGVSDRNEEIYITKVRHKELLESAKESLLEVIKSIDAGMPEDFFSIDLINAYKSLGEIIGEEIEDDLADRIFKEFCMGK